MATVFCKNAYSHYNDVLPPFKTYIPHTRTRKRALCWKGVKSLLEDYTTSLWIKSCLKIGNSILHDPKQNRYNFKMSSRWLQEAQKRSAVLKRLVLDILEKCKAEFKDRMKSKLEIHAGISICAPTHLKRYANGGEWHRDSFSHVHRVFWVPLIHDGDPQTGGTLFYNEASGVVHNTVVGTVETWLGRERHRGTTNKGKKCRVSLFLDVVEDKPGLIDGS